MNEDLELRYEVLLSLQRALLGEVSPALRCVDVAWEGKVIKIICFFDGEISEEDKESMSCVETEVIADFSEDYDISLIMERMDAECPLPEFGPSFGLKSIQCVYQRREENPLLKNKN